MAVQGKAIKQRIRSVRNTKKITKAMELVAASKVRRIVLKTIQARPYATYSWEALRAISGNTAPHVLLESNGSPRTLVVLITSNRGLCGAYNAQAIKKGLMLFQEEAQCDFVTIGKKGDTALRRAGASIVATFTVHEALRLREILPIATFLVQEFTKKTYGKVLVVYTDYISALVQVPNVKQLLPFVKEESETKQEADSPYLFEPDKDAVFDAIVENIIHTQLYTMFLESTASEESARMLAMKSASDAAEDMIQGLTLTYNKIRQAGITQEIAEISAGMTSIN